MTERDLGEMMDRLDEKGAGSEGKVKRTFARWPFRHASLRLTLDHPGGSRAEFPVACRNISRGGVGVLHNAYVHTGTNCTVSLPRADGVVVGLRGSVVRCSHVKGLVHELGIRFENSIRLNDYVQLDPLMGWSSFEKVDGSTLEGSVVVVTDSALDQRIIGHYLSDTRLKLRFIETAEECAALERGAADIAVVDLSLKNAPEVFRSMRDLSIASSLVAVGPNASTSTRKLLQEVEADGFVFKPLSSDRLLSVLAECLFAGDAVKIDPALAGESSGALVASCIEQLQASATDLRDAIEQGDPMRCYAICQHVKAIAVPIGLRPIATLADQAATSVAQSMSVGESAGKLHEIARACERIKISGRSR
ncbi:MAG: PilZ domain-containing protein [Phycisphaerales bacterium]|nr:PilZ domain-containing protein [Phycisphaerales bacterium]